jgi:bacteriocin biosynthesis cyclodehydratase domain-containing protein
VNFFICPASPRTYAPVIDVERSQMRDACGATLPLMRTERAETVNTSQATHTSQATQEISGKSHLRLKEGISIYRTPIGLRCGTARSSFAIPEKGYVRALEILSGSHGDEIDIAESCGMTADEYRELIWHLEEHEFLETSPSILSVTTRFQSVAKHKRRDILPDASFSQLQKRVAPELSHTRLLPGVNDSGASIINARQNVRIEIYGSDRIATLLYGILLSSGVTYTHFALGTRSHDPLIIDTDLSAGFIRSTDVGQSYRQRMEDLGKELSLFPIERLENAQELDGEPPERYIKIHVGAMDTHLLSQWMSAGQEHIVISPPDGGKCVIGPLVQPGKTPCTRCRNISIEEVDGSPSVTADKVLIGDRPDNQEMPVFVAHYLAGLIASFILQRIDSSTSDLTGAYMEVDSLALSASSLIPVSRNPACGCHWL